MSRAAHDKSWRELENLPDNSEVDGQGRSGRTKELITGLREQVEALTVPSVRWRSVFQLGSCPSRKPRAISPSACRRCGVGVGRGCCPTSVEDASCGST